ncbi:DUF1254 domain-containing protein [Occultella gossypii]|uniref:DUF1254 domain-containing protein n=1 Tax=Occultella gossypii TaxID=2800820 RepID=A0ABS7S8V7_9MICO|nr:DUF1254 domain-containing protein [Occultella gossypii]MBZ2196788.1 DUF1254 domain-containing protein [Occultella gossypii]
MDVHRAGEIAFEAYQYAYSLVTMDVTRRQATNVPNATAKPMKAPVNQFAHFRRYPEATAREVVRFNFDTLYSFAWLDVTEEPVVLSVPDSGGRYYLTPMLDMWSDVFAVPGTRTTGGVARDFAVVGPGWSQSLPDGIEVLRAPTPVTWVMGRTQCNGPGDYANVHAIQDDYRIVPLSQWGSDFVPPGDVDVDPAVDDVTAPLDQVNAMNGVELLAYFAELVKVHPPHPHDYPILERLKTIGLVVGESFDVDALTSEQRGVINDSAVAALQDMVGSVTDGSLGTWVGPWVTIEGGTYGTDYRRRAMVAMAGLGCNLPEDALYPGTATDADGGQLTGDRRYVLRFEAGQLPPADAFWSLTMYDEAGFQVPNPINRFAIGDRDALQFDVDGSLELYLQQESPGPGRESNWLPSPAGPFQPMLRIYSPKPEALRRGIALPPIQLTS